MILKVERLEKTIKANDKDSVSYPIEKTSYYDGEEFTVEFNTKTGEAETVMCDKKPIYIGDLDGVDFDGVETHIETKGVYLMNTNGKTIEKIK